MCNIFKTRQQKEIFAGLELYVVIYSLDNETGIFSEQVVSHFLSKTEKNTCICSEITFEGEVSVSVSALPAQLIDISIN